MAHLTKILHLEGSVSLLQLFSRVTQNLTLNLGDLAHQTKVNWFDEQHHLMG